MNIDDPRSIERADPHRAHEVLSAFPAQCRCALTLVAAPRLSVSRPSLVVLAGMGVAVFSLCALRFKQKIA